MARSRYKFITNRGPYFLTMTVVNWTPIFSSQPITKILLDSLCYLQREERLTLYAYVILENHLHLIAEVAVIAKEVASFRSYTARQIIDFLQERKATHVLQQLEFYKVRHKTDRTYQLWQEGAHPQLIQGDAMMRQKIEYIHNNPVKRGYVDLPVDWRYSSARNYAGQEGLIPVTTSW